MAENLVIPYIRTGKRTDNGLSPSVALIQTKFSPSHVQFNDAIFRL